MFLVRGIVFSHEAVREWEAKLAPLLADELRQRRRGRGGARGRHWHVDETYLKVRGRWCYLYRAIDRDGRLGRVEDRRGGCSLPVGCWRRFHPAPAVRADMAPFPVPARQTGRADLPHPAFSQSIRPSLSAGR